ncbi:MAG: hypothetical protein E7450_07265 [Ruminococcaceae bacterium]|nr:hypothetical protein [Oscillospiraceae bacterium]
MDISYYKNMEPIFGEWHIKRLIGEGNFGKVFEIERTDFGRTYSAALKVITIPQNESEAKNIMADGMDEQSVSLYYRDLVEEIVNEFALMSKFKGNTNIVSCEDHKVLEHQGEIRWDILIRMELLTPLNEYIAAKGMTRTDIIHLGIDICKALEFCKRQSIIHRDIKPENIFVSEYGNYKLGDFGIARTAEKTTSGLSKKGTYNYMAPEVYLGQPYGPSVDLYSLGLVLYRLLNNNRTPFLPAYPNRITYSDKENANAKRINGEQIPAPVNADPELAAVVLKSCARDPAQRFATPEEMRLQLECLLAQSDCVQVPGSALLITPQTTDTDGGNSPFAPSARKSSPTESVFAAPQAAQMSEPSQFISLEEEEPDKTESIFAPAPSVPPHAEPAVSGPATPVSTMDTDKTEPIFAPAPTAPIATQAPPAPPPAQAAPTPSHPIVQPMAAAEPNALPSSSVTTKESTADSPSTKKRKIVLSLLVVLLGIGLILLLIYPLMPKQIAAGDYITFGRYEQDNNPSNGTEDIEWLVLDVQADRALVISQYALDAQPYHIEAGDVTWETCSLRQWLNRDFIQTAFSPEEQTAISITTLENAVFDKVFLLSIGEFRLYCSDFSPATLPTAYAATKISVTSEYGFCQWFLRTSRDGDPLYPGFSSDDYLFYSSIDIETTALAVRPAMWIDLDAYVSAKSVSTESETANSVNTSADISADASVGASVDTSTGTSLDASIGHPLPDVPTGTAGIFHVTGASIRSAPVDGSVMYVTQVGTPCDILDQADNGWYKIRFVGNDGATHEGYIRADFVYIEPSNAP